ncbi:ABC transporter ATP-binding protein [Candidatus Hydrogenosomobacter endosymbioticus]|uniref:ABC transporter ATP-binding protein n=1 Tax=Candidatus Hydrogenosomobacter endosymbioticus TaxID=2558174 RepID=A0ABM7V9B6_9PROT|nr:ABC transporter ATP-binding protein [Candidatus Hydrogenosomobacter endosymbioticus]
MVFDHVCKSFNDKGVLQGVSLDVCEKESLVIVGRSGAGKSVLLRCALGFMRPDSGKIFVNGSVVRPAERNVSRFCDIGVVFQSSALFDGITIWENVAFRLLNKMSRKKAMIAAIDTLLEVGMSEGVANLYPSEISGGMQRRVALARAIVARPKILFFDEPTSGLDPIFSSMISELIRKCIRSLGATAVTITHDISGAQIIGDSVAMLYKGKIEWIGRSSDMMNSGNAVLDQFVRGDVEGPIEQFQR